MFDEAIRSRLQGIFRGISGDLIGIENDILKTPMDAFTGSFWDNLLSISMKIFMPVAILLLAIFVAGELYNAYCKSNGELDIQLVSTTFFKLVIPFILITRSYDVMNLIYTFFNKLVKDLSWQMVLQNAADATANVETIMSQIDGWNFLAKFDFLMQLMVLDTGVKIIGAVIFVVCYGRLFEIMLSWLIAPLPLATLVHSEHKQIGQNYLKMFLALALQGILIFVCLMIYQELLKGAAFDLTTESNFSVGWQMAGYTILLAYMLIKSGGLSKRLLGTF